MYQSLALPPQPPYPHEPGTYLHPPPSSPVYVPSRVPAVLPYLHHDPPGWPQTPPDGPSFTPSSPHPPHGFSYPHSPPLRDGGYQSPLVLGSGPRADQFGGGLRGSYTGPYAYMSPDMATASWSPGPGEGAVMAPGGRRSNLGERGAAGPVLRTRYSLLVTAELMRVLRLKLDIRFLNLDLFSCLVRVSILELLIRTFPHLINYRLQKRLCLFP